MKITENLMSLDSSLPDLVPDEVEEEDATNMDSMRFQQVLDTVGDRRSGHCLRRGGMQHRYQRAPWNLQAVINWSSWSS
jgi:hypothetical protein